VCYCKRVAQDRDQCEHGNEPSGTIKGGEFVDQLSDHSLLKKNCTP